MALLRGSWLKLKVGRTMNAPGFTAGASLYRSARHYVSASGPGGFASPESTVSATADWASKIGTGAGAWSDCDIAGGRCCGPDAAVNTMQP